MYISHRQCSSWSSLSARCYLCFGTCAIARLLKRGIGTCTMMILFSFKDAMSEELPSSSPYRRSVRRSGGRLRILPTDASDRLSARADNLTETRSRAMVQISRAPLKPLELRRHTSIWWVAMKLTTTLQSRDLTDTEKSSVMVCSAHFL